MGFIVQTMFEWHAHLIPVLNAAKEYRFDLAQQLNRDFSGGFEPLTGEKQRCLT
jgi:hypothetical protein